LFTDRLPPERVARDKLGIEEAADPLRVELSKNREGYAAVLAGVA
jgi:hypothetical protein